MTLGELGQFLQAVEQQDRLDWMRTSHQMALLYNINRGKGKARSWEDFNPFVQGAKRNAPPAQVTPATHALFERMQTTMNNGPESKRST